MGMADDELVNALMRVPPAQSLEGAEQRAWPNGLWGPKTASGDAAWYLPESMIGEMPYRYQGVAHHGALAALTGAWTKHNLQMAARIPGPTGWAARGLAGLTGLLTFAPNAGYAVSTIADGRTGPVARVEDQLPMPTYPPWPKSDSQ